MVEQHGERSRALTRPARGCLLVMLLAGVVSPPAHAQRQPPSAIWGDRLRVELTAGPEQTSQSIVGVLRSADPARAILVTDDGERHRVDLSAVHRTQRFRAGGCAGASGRIGCALVGAAVGVAAGYATCRYMESCYLRDSTGNGVLILSGVGGILGGIASSFFGHNRWEDVRLVPLTSG